MKESGKFSVDDLQHEKVVSKCFEGKDIECVKN